MSSYSSSWGICQHLYFSFWKNTKNSFTPYIFFLCHSSFVTRAHKVVLIYLYLYSVIIQHILSTMNSDVNLKPWHSKKKTITPIYCFFSEFVRSKALNGERASHFTNGGFPTSAEKNVMNIRTFFECYSGGEKKKTENDFSQQCVLWLADAKSDSFTPTMRFLLMLKERIKPIQSWPMLHRLCSRFPR